MSFSSLLSVVRTLASDIERAAAASSKCLRHGERSQHCQLLQREWEDEVPSGIWAKGPEALHAQIPNNSVCV